jgi:RNA polymerase sigma-70 factor (ECF subfamily)
VTNEVIGRAMEACRPYLLTVANHELASGLSAKAGASDLVQETYLEAQRDLDKFQGTSEHELKGWLRRILLNNLSNFVRRYRSTRKRQTNREVSMDRDSAADALMNGLQSPAPSPSGVAMLHEQQARVQEALDRLKERDRQVIIWRSQEHCSWDEIGNRLGGTPGMAQKAWSRAIQRLRDALGDEPGSMEAPGPGA